ncbi:hypothetical protein PSHT_12006, partial [Puccinia striiformis]
ELSDPQEQELNFLTTFLQESSRFVAPVKGIRKIFWGKMFSIEAETKETDFSNNLSFTQDEFLNKTHSGFDTSKTAFLLISNINKTHGSIHLQPNSTFTGRVAIDLRKLDGICQIVFDAGQFKHCTQNSLPHPTATTLGFSLQITKTCVDAFKHITSGYYSGKATPKGTDYYIGNQNHTFNKIMSLIPKSTRYSAVRSFTVFHQEKCQAKST